MKKLLLTLFPTVMVTAVAQAQQISVVSSNGSTTLYSTLQEAIEGASDGSVIYLPGGGFPISDDVKITKKLTIIGIGHKIDTENVDGYTTVSGNLYFNEGSDGSALMGVYVAGSVFIGDDGKEVDDILIRYCSIHDLWVKNNQCLGTAINQNYIRGTAYFAGSSAYFTNNITHGIHDLDDGFISNNILTGAVSNYSYAMVTIDRTSITNNIIINSSYIHYGSDCLVSGNMLKGDWGEDCINIGEADWKDVFMNWNNGTISPASDFHFSDNYKKYQNQVGIYAGDTPFNDNQMAPVPYIVAKHVDEHTDTTGKLNIKIRVKAGQ